MRKVMNRLSRLGFTRDQVRTPKRNLRLACEQLEARDMPASIMMYPGGDSQADLLQVDDSSTQRLGDFLVTRDVKNQIIDFNHDGNPDVIELGYLGVTGPTGYLIAAQTVYPLLGDEAGGFRYTTVNPGGKGYTGEAIGAVVDYSGDGFQDLITILPSQRQLRHYINNGDGTFTNDSVRNQVLPFFDYGLPIGISLPMADVNGDGAMDILIPDLARNNFTLFNGTLSSGTWDGKFDLASPQLLPFDTYSADANVRVSNNYNAPVCADVNGDGAIDIIMQGPAGIRVFPNNGSGLFSSHLDFATTSGKPAPNLLAADFNEDGKIDIAATSGKVDRVTDTGVAPLNIFINTTTGTGTPTFAPAAAAAPFNLPISTLAAADMNLDGHLDIVGAIVGDSTYRVYAGAGNGTFDAGKVFSGFNKHGAESGGIGIADWNHDGQMDVAVGTRFRDYSIISGDNRYNPSIGISLNGTFAAPGINPRTLTVATVGQSYSQSLVPTGGAASLPYTIAVDPTNPLPPGLSLDANNRVVGVPTRSGPFQVVFRVTQPNGLTGTTLAYLLVNPATQGSLQISPSTIANVNVNQSVGIQFSTAGGVAPYSYTVTSGALPPGLNLSGTGFLTGKVSGTGTYTFGVSATDFNGSTGYRQYTVVSTVSSVVPVLQSPTIVAGAMSGNRVTVFDASGNPRASFRPFANSYKGGSNVAQGDVNGDGVPDLIVAMSSGAQPQVRVFNGNDLSLITAFIPYNSKFKGGVQVAAGDLDGDGRAEVITGPGNGESSRVRIHDGTTGALIREFVAFAPAYRGGVKVAAGDVDGDGKADIIVGSGANMRATVLVYKGTTGDLLSILNPFSSGYNHGVTLGVGDINNDGHADILVGTVGYASAAVKVYSGTDNSLLHQFDPYGPRYRGGKSITTADLTGDGIVDIVTGKLRSHLRPVVKSFNGATFDQIDAFFAYMVRVGISVAAR